MLRLNLPEGPYWLNLVEGVRLYVRPLTTAVYAAARFRGARLGKDLAGDQVLIASVGGRVEDLPDAKDPDGLAGVSQMLFAQALAQHAILKWEGVGNAEGTDLAPVDEENINRLMLFPKVAEDFLDKYTAVHTDLVAEGNGSGGGSNGTSAPAPRTAKTAPKKKAPVRRGKATKSARTTKTSRKPRKAGSPGTA